MVPEQPGQLGVVELREPLGSRVGGQEQESREAGRQEPGYPVRELRDLAVQELGHQEVVQ